MNHYDTLEVSPRASQEVIRAAYRSLMQRFHPDRNPGDQAAATRAAEIASAYEVLSDVQRRARYDADVEAARRPGVWSSPIDAREQPAADWAQPVAGGRARYQPGPQAGVPGGRWRIGLWALAALVAFGGLLLFPVLRTRGDPAAELDAIRLGMSSDAIPEAERRRLYARKLAILEENPDLARRASAQRSDDMAARTFALIASPLVVRVNQPPGGAGAPLELTVPAISVLLGTFDAGNLMAHMERHRERLVEEVAAALAREGVEALSGPQADARIKLVVGAAVMAALGITPSGEYPSTYFDSPGRYGVAAVLLPEGFRLVRLEPAR